MNKLFPRKNGQLSLFKIIIEVLSLILLLVSTLSYILFSQSKQILTKQISESAQDSLLAIQTNQETMVRAINNLGYELLFDYTITPLLYGEPDPLNIIDANGQLRSLCELSPYVSSIYIWNSRTNSIYSTVGKFQTSRNDFFDQGVFTLLDNYMSGTIRGNGIARIEETPSNSKLYSFIFCSTPATPTTSSYIILNIPAQRIDEQMQSSDCDTFIMNEYGQLDSHSSVDSFANTLGADLTTQDFAKEIMASQNAFGFFSPASNERLVIFAHSLYTRKYYVRLYNYSTLYAGIDHVRNITLLTGFTIFLIGCIISFFFSRRITLSFDRINNNLKNLEKKYRQNFYLIKQNALYKLLTQNNLDAASTFLSQHGIDLPVSQSYFLILLQIDDFYNFSAAHTAEDRSLIQYAILNIAHDIVTSSFQNETIEGPSNTQYVLVRAESNVAAIDHELLNRLCHEIQDAVNELFSVSLSCVISDIAAFSEISSLYDATEIDRQYLIYYTCQTVLFHGEIEKADQPYTYPVAIEKELIKKIQDGDADGANMLFEQIITSLHTYPVLTLRTTLFRLLGAIDAKESMYSSSSESLSFYNEVFQTIAHSESLESLICVFHKLFGHLISQRKKWSESKYSSVFLHVFEIVHAEIGNSNLSLEMVSSLCHLSPEYLGRLFKQNFQKSIGSYILETRIDLAKELLTSSDIPIGQISDQLGFTNRKYFSTVFKKHVGVSPNEFRFLHNTKSLACE